MYNEIMRTKHIVLDKGICSMNLLYEFAQWVTKRPDSSLFKRTINKNKYKYRENKLIEIMCLLSVIFPL